MLNYSFSRRVTAGALAVLVVSQSANAAIDGLVYVDQYILPYSGLTNATVFNNTALGGLSGIDRDPATGNYYAISDDRSQTAPAGGDPSARFYNLSINVNLSGFVGPNPVAINSVQTLKKPDNSTFAATGVDPESIRLIPGTTPTLYWTSEGAVAASSVPSLQNPFARQMNLDGTFVRELNTPTKFNPDAVPNTVGIRNNLAFESLTISTDHTRAYVGTENGLAQDGLPATVLNGTNSRVIQFDLATGNAQAEYVYPVDPVINVPDPTTQFATNGLVELLAVGEGEFLAVERSFSIGAPGRGNNIRIYSASLSGATDVSALNSLTGETFTSMSKTLLLEFPAGGAVNPDNIEGLTFGPVIDGIQTFVLVSDNNFSSGQVTQFVLLAVPEPAGLSILCAGLTLVMRRRRRAAR